MKDNTMKLANLSYLIDTSTGERIGEFISNYSMTLDDVIDLFGCIINNMNDPLWHDDGDNVIIDGRRYWYEDLDIEW